MSALILLLISLCALYAYALPLSQDATALRKRWSSGIPDGSMIINNIALGFLPDFDTTSVSSLNSALPLPMPVVGDYIPISSSDTSLGGFYWHKADIASQSVKPVYMATIELSSGLYDFDSSQADVISKAMAQLNSEGVAVWVRFAYEMNGCPAWNAWGCDPQGFKQAWNTMASSLRYWAPGSKMLWSPNIDGSNGGEGNYGDYYPGDDTVDIVGLSFYSFGENQQDNTPPGAGLFTDQAGPFYNAYSAAKGKPFVLAETSAAYHYYTGTNVAAVGGTSEVDIKQAWLNQIIGWEAHNTFPNMIAAVWFNYEKDERDQTIDYRALEGNSAVQSVVYDLVNWVV